MGRTVPPLTYSGRRLQLGLDAQPATAVEAGIGPEVIPDTGRQVDIARAARLEHRSHEQIRTEQVLIVDVVRRPVA